MFYNWFSLVLLIALIFSVYTDFKFSKIKNYIIVSLFILSNLFFLTSNEYRIGIQNIIGLFLPLLLLFLFYIHGSMGAGDIKLFMVMGYHFGYIFILKEMFVSFLLVVLVYVICKFILKKYISHVHLSIYILVSFIINIFLLVKGVKLF